MQRTKQPFTIYTKYTVLLYYDFLELFMTMLILKRRFRSRRLIPIYIGTPCICHSWNKFEFNTLIKRLVQPLPTLHFLICYQSTDFSRIKKQIKWNVEKLSSFIEGLAVKDWESVMDDFKPYPGSKISTTQQSKLN